MQTDNKVVWIFLGDKLGDNAQVKYLGTILEQKHAYKIITKHIDYDENYKRSNIKLDASLVSVLESSSDNLEIDIPPDLILFTGRKAVPLARWIQSECANKFNKKTKLVSIGKPRAPFFWFDLIISTRQYQLPNWIPNLIINNFTLNRLDIDNNDTNPCQQVLSSHKNFTAVLLGGQRSGFKIRDIEIDKIIKTLRHYVQQNPSGSLIVMGSKSTPDKLLKRISEALSGKANIFYWNSPSKPDYQAVLKSGNTFFVSEDSASMMTEAISTGKPVYLLELFQRKKPRPYSPFYWLKRLPLLTLYPLGLYDPKRSVRLFTNNLIDKGHICLYKQKQHQNPNSLKVLDDELQYVVNKINSLF